MSSPTEYRFLKLLECREPELFDKLTATELASLVDVVARYTTVEEYIHVSPDRGCPEAPGLADVLGLVFDEDLLGQRLAFTERAGAWIDAVLFEYGRHVDHSDLADCTLLRSNWMDWLILSHQLDAVSRCLMEQAAEEEG